jgi:hypothetical protein
MKTMKNIVLFFGVVSFLSFVSCDIPVAFGERLDVEGPVLTIISPKPRKAVKDLFTLEGTVTDATGVAKMLIKVSQDNNEMSKMWLYEGGTWMVSENSGLSWTLYQGGVWYGSDKSASWNVEIEMKIGGVTIGDGEYMFIVQAWDKGGFSDANSFKTLTLIIDNFPPKVEIANPYIHKSGFGVSEFTNADLQALHELEGNDWKTPELIGKFQTQGFMLQWQIEDEHDLWSFDIRFFDYDTFIDNNHDTPLPTEGLIYSYHQNDPIPPVDPDPLNYIRPNGSVMVPALDGAAGDYGNRGIIFKSVTEKTTIKVVAVCYDAAENANQEKTLGYFIYWPQADYPWITYTQGMFPLSHYYTDANDTAKKVADAIESEALMIYPGRTIRANAFHYLGLKEVSYTLWLYTPDTDEKTYTLTKVDEFIDITIPNPARNGAYSTIFQWDFQPLPRSATYIIRAVPRSLDEKDGDIYEAVFKVQDITFPEFTRPPQPSASDPLFMRLNPDGTSFTISGTVSDATEITSLCLVWVNPESTNYSAMSQLEYFRDQNYAGWIQAKARTPGSPYAVEDASYAGEYTYPYDSANPNRLWNIATTNQREDPETRRILYDYSRVINLSDLKIGMNDQPLRSQVFLLRAENPDHKTTIITYAPQGDTNLPSISIDKVEILLGDAHVDSFIPKGKEGWTADEGFKLVPKFKNDNDRIRIHGSWIEDSAEYLPPATYFYPNMEFTINGIPVSSATGAISYSPTGTTTSRTGTFTVTASVGQGAGFAIQRSAMVDTMVVNAKAKDFGGNSAEDGASWLVESDELRFLRISSDMPDTAYRAGQTIPIFLEFNKPVMLKQDVANPALNLNTGGTATYQSGQTRESTKQYFDYIVLAGHNASALNVNSLNPNDNGFNDASYRFSWVHTASGGQASEIRIVSENRISTGTHTFSVLPTSGIQSLSSNKSIEIDTTPPTIESITGTPGWHGVGAEIYINVKFSEPVAIGTPTPYLVLNLVNATGTQIAETNRRTSTASADIRVNTDTITFKYTVRQGDNTPAALQIQQTGGTITDVPGTAFSQTNVNRTITGVYIDTTPPPTPTVTVQNPDNSNAVVSNNVNSTTVNANSGGQGQAAWNAGQIPPGTNTINDLVNVYLNNLRLNVDPNSADMDRDSSRIEYSTNYGTSWSVYNGAITWSSTSPNGVYQITARQIDRAGNTSNWSRPIVFNWDKGALVTSINSTSPNGVYTYNTQRQDSIPITVYFRKPLRFSAAPSIRLNTNGGNERATNITLTPFTANNTYESLTFTYNVAATDSTNGNRLNVTQFIFSGDVRDANAVSVTNVFGTGLPPTASQLPALKNITVQTDALTAGDPAFASTGAGVGINTADNTYNTILTVTFNQSLLRGSNNSEMTITQTAGSYRLPAVLTEAERNTYRSKLTPTNQGYFDQYYIRGTNGLTTGSAVDTSVKYVLDYEQNPASVNITGAITTDIQRLAEALRQAERLTFNATSSAISFAAGGGTDRQLVVTLNGANALRVPGGIYQVVIPAGFVQSELSRPSTAIDYTPAAVGGIARPFIRVKKAQETITVNTGTVNNTPRVVAVQPFQTTAKIDTRTPNSSIRYSTTNNTTTVTGHNWANNTAPTGNGIPNAPTAPTYNTGTPLATSAEIENIGTANTYQGYIWRVLARAFTGTTPTTGSTVSANAEDAAFRTVLTYQMVGMTNANAGEQRMQVGDQVWIRGGDAISSSSIPGYPLTWDDDWGLLQSDGKRAGIRVMTLDTTATITVAGGYYSASTWKWVSWEINVPTYFDTIMGRRETADTELENVIRQYGPKQWAYQRAGWTSYKEWYPMLPGNHRWLDTSVPNNLIDYDAGGKGPINFSGTFNVRANLPVSYNP